MTISDEDIARQRIVLISCQQLTRILQGEDIVLDFPRDAKIVNHTDEFAAHAIKLWVWSSEFDPVPDGGLIPHLELKVKRREIF